MVPTKKILLLFNHTSEWMDQKVGFTNLFSPCHYLFRKKCQVKRKRKITFLFIIAAHYDKMMMNFDCRNQKRSFSLTFLSSTWAVCVSQGDPLWSARLLHTDPQAIGDCHYR